MGGVGAFKELITGLQGLKIGEGGGSRTRHFGAPGKGDDRHAAAPSRLQQINAVMHGSGFGWALFFGGSQW